MTLVSPEIPPAEARTPPRRRPEAGAPSASLRHPVRSGLESTGVSRDDIEGRPLGAISYFVGEALRRLWISRRNTIAAIAMIATALTIPGVFLLVSHNLASAIDEQTGSTRLIVYFEPEASEDDIAAVGDFLATSPIFTSHRLVSPEEAAARFVETFPNLREVVADLDENPLPASYEVDVPEERIDTRDFFDRVGTLRRMSGVEDLQFNWEWIGRLRKIIRLVRLAGLGVGVVLGFAAAFMIANVIRLTMIMYREEIGIMRLVGATESIVRTPFLVEGLLQGIIGGIVTVGVLAALFYGGRQLLDPADALLLNSLFVRFLSPAALGGLVAGGAAAGLLGGWIAVRGSRDEGFQGRE
jgi:cell division transport system permease protein